MRPFAIALLLSAVCAAPASAAPSELGDRGWSRLADRLNAIAGPGGLSVNEQAPLMRRQARLLDRTARTLRSGRCRTALGNWASELRSTARVAEAYPEGDPTRGDREAMSDAADQVATRAQLARERCR